MRGEILPHQSASVEIHAAKTVEVSDAVADRRGRVVLRIRADGENVNQESSATVSAREWRVPELAVREYKEAQKEIARRDFDGVRVSLRRLRK